MDVILTLPEHEIRANPFVDANGNAAFYRKIVDIVCTPLDKTYDDIASIDCARILISPDIQDTWIEAITVMGHPIESIMMTLANLGPKASESIPEHTVVLQDGAFRFNDDTHFPSP